MSAEPPAIEKRIAEIFSVAGLRRKQAANHDAVARLFKLACNTIESGRFESSKKSAKRTLEQQRDYFAPLFGVACLLADNPARALHGYDRLARVVKRRSIHSHVAAALLRGKPFVEAVLAKCKAPSWTNHCIALRKLIRRLLPMPPLTSGRLRKWRKKFKLTPPLPPHSGKLYDRCRVEAMEVRRAAMEGCCYDVMGAAQTQKAGEDDKWSVFHARCKDPVCPTCTRIDAAKMGAVLTRLISNELAFGQAEMPAAYLEEPDPVMVHWKDHDGARLMFSTFTLAHTRQDSLREMLRQIARAWALFIRDDIWAGSKRDHIPKIQAGFVVKLEIEYTAAGWHVHLHVLWKLNAGHVAWHWPRNNLCKALRRVWKRITAKEFGRESYQVDLQELRKAAEPGKVLRPIFATVGGHRKFSHHEARPIADTVAELIKYVTKESAKGAKHGQRGLYDFTGPLFLEYVDGVAQKQIVRTSKNWRGVQKAWEESRRNQLELKAKAGEKRVNWSFEKIMEWARAAAEGKLTTQGNGAWADTSNKLLEVFREEGAIRARKKLEPYVRRFLGDTLAELKAVQLFAWQCLPYPDGPPATPLRFDAIEDEDGSLIKWDFDRAFAELQFSGV